MGNLASVLWQMGEPDEAYWLQQQVVDTRQRIFGDDDPATRAAVAAFETMQRAAGL
jgi:tetratricopeptide repeat protein